MNTTQKKIVRIILLILLIFLGILILSYFSIKECKTDEICFQESLSTERPSTFIKDNEGTIFLYHFEGCKKEFCQLQITISKVSYSYSEETRQLLEGKSMECTIPKSQLHPQTVTDLEQNIDYCSGPLKEAMYELMLQKIYGVIAKNLGTIIKEMKSSLNTSL